MANIKTTQTEWGKCREYYEAGLSLSQIAAKTGISKTQISKRSNIEGWSKGTEKEQLIADAVRIETAKGTLTEQAAAVHKELVDERTRHIQFFNQAALKNVSVAIKKIDTETTQAEHRLLADTIAKGREVVLGRTPDTIIQNTNAQQTQQHITYEVVK